jgi:hypothetical protein
MSDNEYCGSWEKGATVNFDDLASRITSPLDQEVLKAMLIVVAAFVNFAPSDTVIGHTNWSENGRSGPDRMVRRWNQVESRIETATLLECPEPHREGDVEAAKLDGRGGGVDNSPT